MTGAPASDDQDLEAAIYPTAGVLEAVREACGNLESLDRARQQILSRGWTEISDVDSTPVAPLLSFTRGMIAQMQLRESELVPMTVFRGDVAGEELYLVLSGGRNEQIAVTSCDIFDVAETRQLDRASVVEWVGRPPDFESTSEMLSSTGWMPGPSFFDDRSAFETWYIPEESPVVAFTQITGIALKSAYMLRSDVQQDMSTDQEIE